MFVFRLREQMVIHWDTSVKRLCTQLTQFMSNCITDTPQSEVNIFEFLSIHFSFVLKSIVICFCLNK